MLKIHLQEYKTHKESFVKKFELTHLPPYLILCVKVREFTACWQLFAPLSTSQCFMPQCVKFCWEICILVSLPYFERHLFLQRFTKNNFFVEKNPTIVNFPIKYVSYVHTCVYTWTYTKTLLWVVMYYVMLSRVVARDIDMAEFLSSDPEVQDAHPHTVYDLVANICHDGQPG